MWVFSTRFSTVDISPLMILQAAAPRTPACAVQADCCHLVHIGLCFSSSGVQNAGSLASGSSEMSVLNRNDCSIEEDFAFGDDDFFLFGEI
jgi:hypothetical protein